RAEHDRARVPARRRRADVDDPAGAAPRPARDRGHAAGLLRRRGASPQARGDHRARARRAPRRRSALVPCKDHLCPLAASELTICKSPHEIPASFPDVMRVFSELSWVSRAARLTPVIATLTCSTAEVCCLVLSSISRAASLVITLRAEICLKVASTSLNFWAPPSTALFPSSVRSVVALAAARISSMS